MRRTFKTTIFQVCDKVIVAVLVILAVYHAMLTFISRTGPQAGQEEKKAQEVRELVAKIIAIQAQSRHEETVLGRDYLTATTGGVRPDIVGVLGPEDGTGPRGPKERELELPPTGAPVVDKVRIGDPELWGCELRVADGGVVRAEWALDDRTTVVLTPLRKGETTVEFLPRGGQVLHKMRVVVKQEQRPEIGAPPGFAAVVEQGQVKVSFGVPAGVRAKPQEVRVFRNRAGEAQALYVRVLLPEKPDAPVETRLAGGQPGPAAKVEQGRVVLRDADVQGDTTYEYAVQAEGISEVDKAELLSEKSAAASVYVAEPFKIQFYQLSPTAALIGVSVLHVPRDKEGQPLPARAVEDRRITEPGEAIGRKVTKFYDRDRKEHVGDVDFTTDYMLLDILGNEAAIGREDPVKDRDGKVIGVYQTPKTQHKALIISGRGRIKVLGPSVPKAVE